MNDRTFSIGEQIGAVKRQAAILRGKYESQLRSPGLSDTEKRAAGYEVECMDAAVVTLESLQEDIAESDFEFSER